MNLRTPGPIPVPDEVVAAGTHPMINHRGPEFAALIERTSAGLKQIYGTQSDVLVLSSSGTGGMEAAVVNHVSPGDRVLVVTIGVFGKRFVDLVRTYGGEPVELAFDFGSGADPQRIDEALAADGDLRTVLVTHNETSTGSTNPLAEIAKVVRDRDRLLIVDAISSLSSVEVRMDDWGLDVVVSGSQKGWMTAPGLALVGVSERAWEAQRRCTTPRFYFDLQRARTSLESGQTPWTPAVSLFFQLDHAVQMILDEGIENVWARHHRTASTVRSRLGAMGYSLFADEAVRSDTVTAFQPPDGLPADEIRSVARTEFDTVFAGGQGPLKGNLLRFGHMGRISDDDLEGALSAAEGALARVRAGAAAGSR